VATPPHFVFGVGPLPQMTHQMVKVRFLARTEHFCVSKNYIKSGICFRENLYGIFLVDLLENYRFATKVNVISPIGSEK
jgi:hypothetical protein